MQRSITTTPGQASNRRGFTIVELLIVIVVIAILAAITVVAYNGVKERANSAVVTDTAKSYLDALALWAAYSNGVYPIPASNAGTCLGPASAFSGTVCPNAPYWGSSANFDLSFNQTLNDYRGKSDGSIGLWAGSPVGVFWYHSNYFSLGHAVLWYAVGPNTDCGLPNIENTDRTVTGAKYTSRDNDHTSCIVQIN